MIYRFALFVALGFAFAVVQAPTFRRAIALDTFAS